MKIKFNEIVIPITFERTKPRESKINKCRMYYDTYGELDRSIVINKNNYLIDGYVAYLALKEKGFVYEEIDVKKINGTMITEKYDSYINIPTIYVFGKHKDDGKEFMWRIPESKKGKASSLAIGQRILVNTKQGNQIIRVTRVEVLDVCPIEFRVRKVIWW